MNKTFVALVAVAAIAVTLDAQAAAPAAYTIVDLGADVQVYAANAAGLIVGSTLSPPTLPVEYVDGAWQTLAGTFSGGRANAINARGVVVGNADLSSVEWVGGTLKVLKRTKVGAAFGIADDGTIVGDEQAGRREHCYRWKAGVKSNFGLSQQNCLAHAIDPTGTYLGGEDMNAAGAQHAFITSPTGTVDLGTLGTGSSSMLLALNRHGHGAVYSEVNNTGQYSAAYWNGTALVGIALGTSIATAINREDQLLVVGSDGLGHRLFLYEAQDAVVTPIEPLISNLGGWTFDWEAAEMMTALSDDGTIYGSARLDGAVHAFELIPVAP